MAATCHRATAPLTQRHADALSQISSSRTYHSWHHPQCCRMRRGHLHRLRWRHSNRSDRPLVSRRADRHLPRHHDGSPEKRRHPASKQILGRITAPGGSRGNTSGARDPRFKTTDELRVGMDASQYKDYVLVTAPGLLALGVSGPVLRFPKRRASSRTDND